MSVIKLFWHTWSGLIIIDSRQKQTQSTAGTSNFILARVVHAFADLVLLTASGLSLIHHIWEILRTWAPLWGNEKIFSPWKGLKKTVRWFCPKNWLKRKIDKEQRAKVVLWTWLVSHKKCRFQENSYLKAYKTKEIKYVSNILTVENWG